MPFIRGHGASPEILESATGLSSGLHSPIPRDRTVGLRRLEAPGAMNEFDDANDLTAPNPVVARGSRRSPGSSVAGSSAYGSPSGVSSVLSTLPMGI
jgi:hypothetical protein